MQISAVLQAATIGSSTIGLTRLNTIGSSTIGSSPVSSTKIISQVKTGDNSKQVVDILLNECSDLIDNRYTGWFAKRFYKLEKNSVLNAANLARKEGKYPDRLFSNMVKLAA